jgi:hypothetical protein
MVCEQTQESDERAFSNAKLKEQGHTNEGCHSKAPSTERQSSCSEIVVDMTAAGPNTNESKAIWFETSLGLIGAQGSISKELFISAVKQIEVSACKTDIDLLAIMTNDGIYNYNKSESAFCNFFCTNHLFEI